MLRGRFENVRSDDLIVASVGSFFHNGVRFGKFGELDEEKSSAGERTLRVAYEAYTLPPTI